MHTDVITGKYETESENKDESMSRGEHLQKTRESMSLSLNDVAQQLHIEKRFIVALENDDYSIFSGEVYVYGCMRAYAKILKLPLDKFTTNTTEEPVKLEEADDLIKVNQNLFFKPVWVVYSLLLVLVVILVWVVSDTDKKIKVNDASSNLLGGTEYKKSENSTKLHSEIDPLTVVPVETIDPIDNQYSNSVDINKADINKLADNKTDLVLTYDEASWTDIKDANGKQLTYRMVEKGEILNLTAPSPFTVILGYSPGVVVKYNGDIFDHTGYAVENVSFFTVGDNKVDSNKSADDALPAIKEKTTENQEVFELFSD